MKLKNIKNREQKKVNTKYIVYYLYKHNFLTRLFLENVVFKYRLSRHTKYLIVTHNDSFPFLGHQQVLKIDRHDRPGFIQEQIKDRLYLQNNYLYFPPQKNILLPVVLILSTVIGVFVYTSTIIINSCFPTPEKYFSAGQPCKIFTFQNRLFIHLLRSKSPAWVNYSQETILRQNLINKLSSDQNPFYLDWLYSHGLAFSPLYANYLDSLKRNSLDLSLVDDLYPFQSLAYELNYIDHKLTCVVKIIIEKNISGIINFNLPADFVIQNLSLNNLKLPSGSYWQKNQSLFVDTTDFPSQINELKLFLDTTSIKRGQSDWSLYFKLPLGQTLKTHTLSISYPPARQIILRQKPHVARTGFIEYNLPTRGISKIDFNI